MQESPQSQGFALHGLVVVFRSDDRAVLVHEFQEIVYVRYDVVHLGVNAVYRALICSVVCIDG